MNWLNIDNHTADICIYNLTFLAVNIHLNQTHSGTKSLHLQLQIEWLFITGVTLIGRDDAPVPQDITIEGPGIEAEHCRIENRGGVIILDPCGHLCSLDGVPVTRPAQLTQGNLNMIALAFKIHLQHVCFCLFTLENTVSE